MGAQPLHDAADDRVVRDLRRQAGAMPPLGAGEQARLLERSARGDHQSVDRLVAAHLTLVIRLAGSRQDRGLSISDLVQEGSLGLVEAVRSFAASGEPDFVRFAERRVADQMDAAIAAEVAAVRAAELLVAAANDYERVEQALHRELHRDPTEVEIAQKLEWTVERTRYVAQAVAEARRAYDEEVLAFIEPDSVDIDDLIQG